MKIDKDLMSAFTAGREAGAHGVDRKACPHMYTSNMSDAWNLGYQLEVTRKILDVAKIVGLSQRGLTFQDDERSPKALAGSLRAMHSGTRLFLLHGLSRPTSRKTRPSPEVETPAGLSGQKRRE